MAMQRVDRWDGSRRARRRGAALVETCVVLPFLMLLTLGTIDLGRYCYAHIATLSAARCGAFYGTRTVGASNDQTGIARTARDETACLAGTGANNPKVRTEVETDGAHRTLRVKVEYTFKSLFPYPGLPRELTLIGKSQMRVLPDLGSTQ